MGTKTNRRIAMIGALGALCVFLGISRLGIIPWFSGASITIMHIPVIIGAIIEGPIVGCAIGIIFGTFSLIQAVIAPAGILDPYFANPFVSILPRALIGLVSWLVFAGFSRIVFLPKPIAAALGCFFGSMSNTFFVLVALLVFKALDIPLFFTILTANGIPEAVGAVLTGTPVITLWKHFETRKKARISTEE